MGPQDFLAPYLDLRNRVTLLGPLLPQVSSFTFWSPSVTLHPDGVLKAHLEAHLTLGRSERLQAHSVSVVVGAQHAGHVGKVMEVFLEEGTDLQGGRHKRGPQREGQCQQSLRTSLTLIAMAESLWAGAWGANSSTLARRPL